MTGVTVVQIAQATAILLMIGSAIIGSLLLIPNKRTVALDVLQALFSMLIVAITILLVFLGSVYTLVPFLMLLAFRIGFEAANVRIGPRAGIKIGVGSAILTALAMLAPLIALGLIGLWLLLLARTILFPIQHKGPLWQCVEVLLFPILPMALLAVAALNPDIRPVILIVYVLVELCDSCAYVVGKLIGKTRIFPVLSPKKTLEGLVGGAACLLIVTSAVAAIAGLSVSGALTLAVLAAIVGTAGDLAASQLKRASGVKDFPAVLRKQGGALDIFDSWIATGATVSAIYLLYFWTDFLATSSG